MKTRYICFQFVGMIFLGSCTGDGGSPADAPAQASLEVVVAASLPMALTLESTGDILPMEEVELRAPVSGNVLSISFEEGARVNKGDLLVKLDDRAWQAQAGGVRARIKNAENDLERKRALLEIDGASLEEVDMAEANLAELQSQLQELEVNISLANIRAPFTGIMGFRDFSVGSYLAQGAPMTRLTQIDQLKVDFDIPSKYAGKVKQGDEVIVLSGNDTATAVVYAIDPSVSNSTRTLGVRAKLNAVAGLSPGNFAQVMVPLSIDSGAIALPTDAIVPELNAQNVYVVKKGIAHKTPVQLGARSAGEVQIISGVNAGDSVIVSGLLMVKDGMKVNIHTGQQH